MAKAVRMPASCWPGRRTKADILSGLKHTVVSSRYIAINTVEYVTDDGLRCIRYHDTDVITFFPEKHGGQIYLNSNGFNTQTTRNRINAALEKAGIRAYMYQRNSRVWFSDAAGRIVEFDNSLGLDSEGKIA